MSTSPAPGTTSFGHRAIVAAALLATYMQAVNISLPNAAVLHIQGGLSMTDDEIGWVFTSYIAASAIVMPLMMMNRGQLLPNVRPHRPSSTANSHRPMNTVHRPLENSRALG